MAFWLLCVVWLLQTVFLLQQVFVEKGFPVLTLNDGLLFYSWILISFSLVISKFSRAQLTLFFLNLLGFFTLLFSISAKMSEQAPEQGAGLIHEMLIAHITLAFAAYGFFTVSFIFSLMYLIQYRLLKRKKGFRWVWQIGDLSQLDTYSFKAITLGVPLLTIAIVLGVTWAYFAGAEFYWFDLKTLGSLLVLGLYVLYLVLRLGKGYQGKAISSYNSAAFLLLLINFFLFSSLSNFHLP
ncbi:cytochrome c biogenesis protein [Barrientosiimonas marina]|uniref:Cytochrome c biogenesis protein CcsA n=1 Tax=Lentibacillus kimchii TaxID=1542911 RepID=A0ABW2UZG6_9BACI